MGLWSGKSLTNWNQQQPTEDDNPLKILKIVTENRHLLGKERINGCTSHILENLRIDMQKSFDHSVDKALSNMVEKLLKPVMPQIQGIAMERAIDILNYSLVVNSAKRYKKSNRESLSRSSKNKEIIENCTSGRYNQFPGSIDDVQSPQGNVFKIPPKRSQQIYWDISKIVPATKFVIESEANQIFGFIRKRLVSLHPQLIHYVLDVKDYQWLNDKGFLPEPYKKKRMSLVLYDQIHELWKNENKYQTYLGNINLQQLKIFTLPETMLKKIRHHIIHLQIRTNGMITIVPPSTFSANNNLKSMPALQVPDSKEKQKLLDCIPFETNESNDLLKKTGSLKSQLYIQNALSNESKFSIHNFKYPSIHHIHKSG